MTTTIRSPPSLGDYTPLSEHQEQTPASFYGGKPILYYHAAGAKAWIPSAQRGSLPLFPADAPSAPTGPENTVLNGDSEEMIEQKVDLFVNSETLTIFSPAAEAGLSIPYPLISIHAVKTLGSDDQKFSTVYLQLELSDGGVSDDNFETVELTLIPPPSAPAATEEDTTEVVQAKSEAAKLFEAISECSDLNPDPVVDGEEDDEYGQIIFEGDHEALEGYTAVYAGVGDGGLPPPMPGSSGWITADNVHEFFDAEGNWISQEGAGGELGEGAGAVRGREEGDINGHDETSESKRPRTD